MEACNRPFSPQSLCPPFSFSYGNLPVGPPFPAPRRLDGLHRPSGCVPPGSCPPGISAVPPVLSWSLDIPVSGSLFWSFNRTASVHPCHGPDLLHYASFWVSGPLLPGRLARPWILLSGDYTGERLPLMALPGVGSSGESLQELSHSCSISRLSGHDSPDESFEGFPDPGTDPVGALSRQRILLLSEAATHSLPFSSRSHVFNVHTPGSRLRMRSLQLRLNVADPQTSEDVLVSWDDSLPPGSWVVVRCQPSQGRSLPQSFSSESSRHGRVGLRLECFARGRPSIWLAVSSCFELFNQPPRASCHSWRFVGSSIFSRISRSPSSPTMPPPRRICLNAVAQATLRLCEANAVHLLPQFVLGRLNVLADSLSRGSQVLGSEWTLCQEVCQELFHRCPVTIILFATSLNH